MTNRFDNFQHKLNWKTREQVVAELCESIGKEMIEIEAEEAARICVASDIRLEKCFHYARRF